MLSQDLEPDDIKDFERHSSIEAADPKSGKRVLLEYPFNEDHDRRPGRADHSDWRGKERLGDFGQKFCVHWSPGHFPPATDQSTVFGSYCAGFMHESEYKNIDSKKNFPVNCTTKGGEGEEPVLTDYVFSVDTSANWYRGIDECRSHCETCFDAMYEYGAEGAMCGREDNRHWARPTCVIRLHKRNFDVWDWDYPTLWVYYNSIFDFWHKDRNPWPTKGGLPGKYWHPEGWAELWGKDSSEPEVKRNSSVAVRVPRLPMATRVPSR